MTKRCVLNAAAFAALKVRHSLLFRFRRHLHISTVRTSGDAAHCSPDRDGNRHTDIAPDRIRVRADGMSTLDEPFSGLSVDASNGHGKRGGQHEASCLISTEIDPGGDGDIVVAKAVAGISAHMKECILKAGCIPAGEELFGIGRVAPTAKRPRQCELEVEQTVFAADRTVTASARRDSCGI
jgi:hypothetical protein